MIAMATRAEAYAKRARCGAKLRHKDARCQQTMLLQNGRCRLHGGRTPSGPVYRGKWAAMTHQYIPEYLRVDFEMALADTARLELGNQLALLDARFAELVRGLGDEAADPGFRALSQKWDQMERADRAGDPTRAGELFAEIREGVMRAARLEKTWQAIYDLIERRRKLVESERKRLLETSELLTMSQTLGLLTILTDAVFTHVHDTHALDAIWRTFKSLAGVDGDKLARTALPGPNGTAGPNGRPAHGPDLGGDAPEH